ncbi:hypothetical protein NQ318_001825 [Aromia moschata]|uniref:C2H2-type domain-containing protein n=1 Tax=Aromia moschata TaxID=1265417 RepID=A0AAV8Z2Z2_9CUCU|nr:hypothetical protein NQ318_001825 [Aromia moschata]
METVNEDTIKCCSLCHQPCRDFSKIDQNTSETIVNLFLRPDISAINQDAVICVRCTNNLLVCSQLKSRCLYSESIIKSFASSKGNLFTDLIEVYLIINEDIRKDDIPKGHTVCRLCLTLIDYESCIYLNDDSKSGTSISILFFKYFPELDLNICKNPVICLPCHSILQTYLNFMRDCVNSKDNTSEECEIKTESNMRQIEQTVIPERVSLNTLKCKNDVTDDQKYIISEEVCIKTETVENDEGSNRVADVSFQPYSELTSAEIANIASFQHSVFETNYNLNVNLQSIVYRDTSEIAIVNSSQPKPVLQSYECHEPKSYETDTKTQFDEPLSKDVSDQKKHKCKLCGYKAKFKSTVKRHMLIHSDSSNRQDGSKLEMYKCEDCDFETKYKVSLKSHKLVHQEIANMQCTVCNFKTKYASSLKKHILIHKDTSEVEMHKCGECDYKSSI